MQPREKTAYELGRLAGYLEGLQDAADLIGAALRDEEGRAT